MMRKLPLFLAVIILQLMSSYVFSSAWAKDSRLPDLASKRYNMASYLHNNLSFQRGEEDRDRWLSCVKSLQVLYRLNTGHEKASLALYMLGNIYAEMHDHFHDPKDLDEAIGYYEDLAMIFPKHSLADDALLILGNISLTKKNNGKNAEKLFARVIAVYPDGDKAQSAALMLLQMKKQTSGRPEPHVPEPVMPMAHLNQPIRFWSTKNYTRIVIESTQPLRFKENFLKAEGDLPKRLYVDLFNCRIAPTFQNPIPIRDGLLKQVRGAQFDQDTVRVVLDTESVESYKIFAMADPFRVVIDVTGTKPKVPQQKLPTLAEQFGLGVKTIVIDPGHGGKDPGAIGINGLQEKDIVLKVAKKVAAILQKETAYSVILTRDRDIYIPLEERTAIANTKEADLFLSIHANSAPNENASGVETYFLSLATSREEMQAAARENAASSSQISDLQKILQDLMQNSKIEESARLAGNVQGELVNGLRSRYEVRNLGVKKAPFIVLIGAQMPSVLTEIAFLSNKEEIVRLQDERYLEAIARYIVDGVRQYVAKLSSL
ncbi:MAG: N-acetylmuramoyl-L-alanine amidase [Deltaproteobacteria bacterium]|nr:N-acetylmuramoyl-L-alanine amidase [Deltaproteobacteria bacterium]